MSKLKEKLLARFLKSQQGLADRLSEVGIATLAISYGRGWSLTRFMDSEGENHTLALAVTPHLNQVFLFMQKIVEILDPYFLQERGEIIWEIGWTLYLDIGEEYEILQA